MKTDRRKKVVKPVGTAEDWEYVRRNIAAEVSSKVRATINHKVFESVWFKYTIEDEMHTIFKDGNQNWEQIGLNITSNP